jgi:hypothetical protein
MPNFDSLTPTKTGTKGNFDIVTQRTVNDGYAFVFTGYVNVPAEGAYTFYTTSDDGSQLYIGSDLVVNNDGQHGPEEASGVVGLKKGKHSIKVLFMETGGGESLKVSCEGPGIRKQALPKSTLFRTSDK